MLRETQRHEVRVRITEATGLLGFLVQGSELVAEVIVSGASQTFDNTKGVIHFEGEVRSIKNGSREWLPTVLRMTGKTNLCFNGDYELPGEPPINVDMVFDDGTQVRGKMDYASRLASSRASGEVIVGKQSRAYWWVRTGKFEGSSVMRESNVIVEPDPEPINSELIRGLMLTDAVCDKDLAIHKAGLGEWRTKYNTILTLLDIQLGRPYVEWVRNKGVLLPLGVKNLKILKDFGFKVHVILLNGPNIRKGKSDKMGSIQRKVSENEAYSADQLACEKAFVDDLFYKAEGLFDGIMPILETSCTKAIPFAEEVYRHIRQNRGFKGVLLSNMIGEAKSGQARFKKYGVLTAASQGNPALWCSDDQDIRNSDGMIEMNHTRHDLIKMVTGNPGKHGFYLWSRELVGSDAGLGTLHEDYLTYAV